MLVGGLREDSGRRTFRPLVPRYALRLRVGLAVLIVSGDSDIGALLAAMLELGGYQGAFARDDERPEDAVARLHPRKVAVVGSCQGATNP